MRIYKLSYLIFFSLLILFLLGGNASAQALGSLDCAPMNGDPSFQGCTETKTTKYNTTLPVIDVNFPETVTVLDYKLYRIGDLGNNYPSDFFRIERHYQEIAINSVSGSDNRYVPQRHVANGIYMFRLDAVNIPNIAINVSVLFTINSSGVKFWVVRPSSGIITSDESPNFAVGTNSSFILELEAERELDACKYSPLAILGNDTLAYAYSRLPFSFTTYYLDATRAFTMFNVTDIYPGYVEGTVVPLSVICREPSGRYTFSEIYVGYDRSAPSISVSAVPNPITDGQAASTNITLSTNDRAACKITKINPPDNLIVEGRPVILRGENYDFSRMDEFVYSYSENLVYSGYYNPYNYLYRIDCTNLAGLSSSANYTVRLNMTFTQNFDFISPAGYINSSSLLINGSTTIGTSEVGCSVAFNTTGPFTSLTRYQTGARTYYSKLLSTSLTEGESTIYVNCTYMVGSRAFVSRTFTVDRVPPTAPNITSSENSCSLERITARAESRDNISGIRRYHYNITLRDSTIDDSRAGTTSSGQISERIDGDVSEGKTYVLRVFAEDNAGNRGPVSPKNIKVTNSSILPCDFVPPEIKVFESRNNETNSWTIRVNCSDDESGCKSSFNYAIETNASKKCNATQNAVLMTPITVSSSGIFCAKVFDLNNNEDSYQKEITVRYPVNCSNGAKDGKETDVDCGGDCQKCDLNKTCSLNLDCSNNFCLNKKCVMPSCTDLTKNGDETGIDCGGICKACAIGGGCISDEDCDTGNCLSGKCAEASCTDSKKDGTESDIDCGGTCEKCRIGDSCKFSTDCVTSYCDSALGTCQINPTLDTDGDGLPDVWEQKYCGSFTGCDPKGDLDGDKYTNLEEFMSGTNPMDPNSVPDYKKYNIFSIIFLVLGALSIIGGITVKIMSVMDEQKKQKEREEMEMRKTLGQIPKMNSLGTQTQVPPVRQLTEEEKRKGEQARLKALKEREMQRKNMISQFDSEDKEISSEKKTEKQPENSKEESKPKEKEEEKKEPPKKKGLIDEGTTDEFVDLSKLKEKKEDPFLKLKKITDSKQKETAQPKQVSKTKEATSKESTSKPSQSQTSTSKKAPPQKPKSKEGDEVFDKLKKIAKQKKKQ